MAAFFRRGFPNFWATSVYGSWTFSSIHSRWRFWPSKWVRRLIQLSLVCSGTKSSSSATWVAGFRSSLASLLFCILEVIHSHTHQRSQVSESLSNGEEKYGRQWFVLPVSFHASKNIFHCGQWCSVQLNKLTALCIEVAGKGIQLPL